MHPLEPLRSILGFRIQRLPYFPASYHPEESVHPSITNLMPGSVWYNESEIIFKVALPNGDSEMVMDVTVAE